MRLSNVCPFRVGDVVKYIHDWRETRIHRIVRSVMNNWHLYWFNDAGRESYWVVDPEDPNHSGIRLLKRGDE